MKFLFALLFALLALPAASQDWCTPYLQCQPLVTKVVDGPLAKHLFWFTRKPSGGLKVNGFSCAKDKCDVAKFATVANDVLTGKKTAAAASAEHLNFACDYSQWTPLPGDSPVCAERKAFIVANHTQWLEGVPYVVAPWKVKPNGTAATRPAYALTNGVRGTREVARATVGAPCDATKPTLASGKDLWAPFGSDPGVVALCERTTP